MNPIISCHQLLDRRRRRAVLLGALGVTVVALALRLPILDRHLPHAPEPDTHMVTYLMARARGDAPVTIQRSSQFYATLLPQLLLRMPGLAIFERPARTASLAEHLRAAARPYVLMRRTIAPLAALLPLITFVIGRRFIGNRAALMAAILVATSLLHLRYSQQARPHAAHATLVWLALLGLIRLVERPSAPRVVGAALSTFLAVGSLQSGILLSPAIAAASWLAAPETRKRLALAAALCVPFALAIATCYPGFSITRGGLEFAPGGHAIPLSAMSGSGWIIAGRILWEEDPVLLVLGLLGMSLLAFRAAAALRHPRSLTRNPRLAVLASYLVPYGLILVLNEQTADRYVLPILPGLAVAAAFAIDALLRASPRAAPLRWLAAAAGLLLPSIVAVRFFQVTYATDTVESAAAWLRNQERSAGARIVADRGLVLPVLGQREAADPSGALSQCWTDYQARVHPLPGEPTMDVSWLPARRDLSSSDAERFLDAEAARWVVIADSPRWRRVPEHQALRDACRRRGELAALFDGGGSEPIDYEHTRHLALELRSASAFGPRIEIYRWSP